MPHELSADVRFALLERDVRDIQLAIFGSDGEHGLSGRMAKMDRFQAKIGGMATLGAVIGGMAVTLFARLLGG